MIKHLQQSLYYVIIAFSCLDAYHHNTFQQEHVHPNHSKTIDYFDAYGNNTARVEMNPYGVMTSEITFYPDGTHARTIYHADGKKTIDEFTHQGRNNLRTEIDRYGAVTKKVTFHHDDTQTITTYHPNRTTTAEHRNCKGKLIGITYTNQYQQAIYASAEQITAWHEAGHALSFIYNHPASQIQNISIQPNSYKQTQGHVESLHVHYHDQSIEDLEQYIISALAGGTAEQILFAQPMLQDDAVLAYFSQPQYAHDLQTTYEYAHKIMTHPHSYYIHSSIRQQKMNELIIRLYKKSYHFLYNHRNEISLLANQLIKKQVLSTREVYAILNMPQPSINR